LLHDVEHLERRIAGLRRWLGERVTEFKASRVCARCGYRHSTTEYRSGYRDDGTGALCCFGFARIKLDELHEAHKLAERRRRDQLCRECGVLLRDGHVEGLCWSCYRAARARVASHEIQELISHSAPTKPCSTSTPHTVGCVPDLDPRPCAPSPEKS
ncbi:MAG: hypothetical protein QXI19_12055, partial [Candidatus Caldarchaeum sp.]